jgi:hypothetical protein
MSRMLYAPSTLSVKFDRGAKSQCANAFLRYQESCLDRKLATGWSTWARVGWFNLVGLVMHVMTRSLSRLEVGSGRKQRDAAWRFQLEGAIDCTHAVQLLHNDWLTITRSRLWTWAFDRWCLVQVVSPQWRIWRCGRRSIRSKKRCKVCYFLLAFPYLSPSTRCSLQCLTRREGINKESKALSWPCQVLCQAGEIGRLSRIRGFI